MSRRTQSTNFHCVKCGKSFKTQTWLQKHMVREHPTPPPSPKSAPVSVSKTVEKPKTVIKVPNAKKKARIKQKISPILRSRVWETYIGDTTKAKCFCCNTNKITPFTSHHTFQAGHILSEKMGGKCDIGNLLPICRDCNKTMGIQHWDDYVKYNRFPVRVFGANIPIETHNHAKKIQRYWRTRKIKKKKKKKKRKRKIPNYMKPTKAFTCYLKSK